MSTCAPSLSLVPCPSCPLDARLPSTPLPGKALPAHWTCPRGIELQLLLTCAHTRAGQKPLGVKPSHSQPAAHTPTNSLPARQHNRLHAGAQWATNSATREAYSRHCQGDPVLLHSRVHCRDKILSVPTRHCIRQANTRLKNFAGMYSGHLMGLLLCKSPCSKQATPAVCETPAAASKSPT